MPSALQTDELFKRSEHIERDILARALHQVPPCACAATYLPRRATPRTVHPARTSLVLYTRQAAYDRFDALVRPRSRLVSSCSSSLLTDHAFVHADREVQAH